MLRSVDLSSLVSSYQHLSKENLERYFIINKVDLKTKELDDLSILVEQLLNEGISNVNNFYVGYKINQISKEFDLLRFSENEIVNIELKKRSTDEKIKAQLEQNRYYLEVLGKTVYTFTYIAEDSLLYQLDNNGEFQNISLKYLIQILENQSVIEIENINSYFDPSNYLVSPFNSTEKFIENQYFLTDHQQSIKKSIVDQFHETSNSFTAIVGNPGTGKTLLTYDLARSYFDQDYSVLIIHGGLLNNGHRTLRDDYGWDICSIRDYDKYLNDKSNYKLIILDESQRIWKHQIADIVRITKQIKANCIFSYDPRQCFSNTELNFGTPAYIEKEINAKVHKLTDKIRSNKEIAAFITNLFDLSKSNNNQKYNNIKIQYFQQSTNAREYIRTLSENNWRVINYTTSNYYAVAYDRYQINSHENAHQIIGQEFDKVVAVIDSYFFYDKDGRLGSNRVGGAPNYALDKMFYQIITRARQKITLVIINNEDVLQKCLNILNPNK